MMDLSELKKNLNRKVKYSNAKLFLNHTEYLLTGCMIRKGDNGFYYTAELQSIQQPKSIMHVPLEEVDEAAP